ncbi:MAG: helix-turn-helix transcriptional regulator [Clostridia bacterium]|nr:helix-turn-helix transcriptional regulator [Clostridia bacterium]
MDISFKSHSSFGISQAGHNFLIKGMGTYEEIPSYCFVYVARGTQNLHIPDIGDVEAPAGSFMIYLPGSQSRNYTSDIMGENYWMLFENFDNEFFSELGFEPYKIYRTQNTTHINEYFEKIIEELLFETGGHKVFVDTLFTQLLIDLWRGCRNELRNEDDLPRISKGNSISLALYMMKSQCQNNYTLDEYAKMCNLSSYRFCHKFREKTGMSPMVYRKLCRLKKARTLIRARQTWSISQIAESVGFESVSYFCSAFKEYFNITPSEYKKEFEKKQKTVLTKKE